MNNFNRHTALPTTPGTSGDVIFYDGTVFTGDFTGGKGIYISNGTNWMLLMSMSTEKVYVALLTQSSLDDPEVVVLKNTLDGDPIVTRSSVGEYNVTLSGAFSTQDKAFIVISHNAHTKNVAAYWSDSNNITINTADFDGTLEDDVLNYTSLEIRIYS